MGMLIDDSQNTEYVITVDGKAISAPYPTRTLAESSISLLPETIRYQATILPITKNGMLLLG